MKNSRSVLKNVSFKALGVLLMVVGVVLLFVPGPGLLIIGLGVAIMLGKSEEAKSSIRKTKEKVKDWIEKYQQNL